MVVLLGWGCAGATGARVGVVGDDPGAEAEGRAAALVARMTLEEKVSQLVTAAPAIPRLGIPAYDWWSESLHGVARNGLATVFPQAIGLGATFDEELVRRVAAAIAAEARAKFEEAHGRERGSGRYGGLTFFAPNVNIVRDPRWGRGQETYGEDPFLTARLGVAYVRGLQGDDPRRLLAAAVGKHFAVHSGPEIDRHRFDARVDARDLADTYLPQFEALVREAGVAGIMAAYNRVNGEPCVASPSLLGRTLRERWGFRGFVVGDCGAVSDLVHGHRLVQGEMQAAALALRAGTDLDCGRGYAALAGAARAGLVTDAEIDRAATRLLAVRFRLGLFDPAPAPPGLGPAGAAVASPAHRALAREAAQKSMVLLENDGTLPISPAVRRIAVIGPTADDVDVLLGNYHGKPRAPVTLLAGIRAAARARGVEVRGARGATLAGRSRAQIAEAKAAARRADLVVLVLGLAPRLEGEENEPGSDNPGGDRRDLGLPGRQPALLDAVLAAGKPTVVVLTGGSAIALPETRRRPNAVLMAWYPGEAGGEALADLLFGDVSPSGRLPVTFYRSAADLPPFADYRMAGRTHRYFTGQPLYPFGHGLGYAPVAYGPAVVVAPGEGKGEATVRVPVENRGARPAGEVVLVYATAPGRGPRDPLRSLVAFRRLALDARATTTVEVPIPAAAFTLVGADGERRPVPGPWRITAGASPAVTMDLPANPS